MEDIQGILYEKIKDDVTKKSREEFLRNFMQSVGKNRKTYIETIQKLPPDVSVKGVNWLQNIVDYYCQRISTMIPSSKLFRIH